MVILKYFLKIDNKINILIIRQIITATKCEELVETKHNEQYIIKNAEPLSPLLAKSQEYKKVLNTT